MIGSVEMIHAAMPRARSAVVLRKALRAVAAGTCRNIRYSTDLIAFLAIDIPTMVQRSALLLSATLHMAYVYTIEDCVRATAMPLHVTMATHLR